MEESLRASVALRKAGLEPELQVQLVCPAGAWLSLRAVKPLGQMSLASSSGSGGPFPRALCLLCTAHLSVLHSLSALVQAFKNEATFPGEVPVAISKLRAFKETGKDVERGDNSVVPSFITLIQLDEAHSRCLKDR